MIYFIGGMVIGFLLSILGYSIITTEGFNLVNFIIHFCSISLFVLIIKVIESSK